MKVPHFGPQRTWRTCLKRTKPAQFFHRAATFWADTCSTTRTTFILHIGWMWKYIAKVLSGLWSEGLQKNDLWSINQVCIHVLAGHIGPNPNQPKCEHPARESATLPGVKQRGRNWRKKKTKSKLAAVVSHDGLSAVSDAQDRSAGAKLQRSAKVLPDDDHRVPASWLGDFALLSATCRQPTM